MPYNLPYFDVSRISIGPSRILIGRANVLPSLDLGAVLGAELKIQAEVESLGSGSPKITKAVRITSAKAELTVTGLEWNPITFQYIFGGYVAVTTGVEMLYGNAENIEAFSMRLIHQSPAGGTLLIDFYRAAPSGSGSISLGYAVHNIPFTFSALSSPTDYMGNYLPRNSSYKITFYKGAS